jgi:hypothetical protein
MINKKKAPKLPHKHQEMCEVQRFSSLAELKVALGFIRETITFVAVATG